MKLSLILNVIDPKIGGVMIMGDRGTGKSTIGVRCLIHWFYFVILIKLTWYLLDFTFYLAIKSIFSDINLNWKTKISWSLMKSLLKNLKIYF